jgi:uncharacterized protein YgbK (DUF1537 family)
MIGVIADDYTGASDVAVAFRRERLRTALLFGTPARDIGSDPVDAMVIALRSRMIPSADASAQSLDALRWLQHRGASQVYFKYCSTFDSTARGNIGTTLDALADALGVASVLTTPSAPTLQRTQYQGYLFVDDKLLSESHMRHHPVTPMTDSYLPRLLHAQSTRGVGVIPLSTVRAGVDQIHLATQQAVDAGRCYLMVDAIAESDLTVIGEAVLDAPLVAGAAGLARGLASAVAARPDWLARPSAPGPIVNPAGVVRSVILAGSCSMRTLEQIREYQRWGGPSHRMDPSRTPDADALADEALRWYDSLPSHEHGLIYSSVPASEIEQIQGELGAARSAAILENAVGLVAAGLSHRAVTRIIVAGGETAGSVVTALGISGGIVGDEAAPGVPWIITDRLELLLKSGNFGDPRLFIDAALAHVASASSRRT